MRGSGETLIAVLNPQEDIMPNQSYFPTSYSPSSFIQEVDFDSETRLRETHLRDQTRRVYQALSFFNLSRGLAINTMLTTSIEALTPNDLPKGLRLYKTMNKALGEWLAIGGTTADAAPSSRRNHRNMMGGSEHAYVYVVENARDMGLHIHQLMHVPRTIYRVRGGGRVRKSTLMHRYLEVWWAKQLSLAQVPADAIHVSFYSTRNIQNALAQQWKWFRYIVKTTPSDIGFPDQDGRMVRARDVFKLDPFIKTEPAPVAQLAGGSHNIWTAAQTKAGFASAYDRGEFDDLYSGWEIDAYSARLEAERAPAVELLKSLTEFDD